MSEHGATLERMYRRMAQVVGFGRITATKDDGNAHQVQVSLGDGQVRDATPVATIYGLHSHARPGSDVVMLFVGGDRSNGVVVATGDQRCRPRNTQPGEVGLYDDQGLTIFLTRDGIRIDAGGKDVVVRNGTKARFEMPIESTGEITAMVDDASVTVSQHVHPGNGAKPTPHT